MRREADRSTDPHGLDSIIGVLYRVARIPLDLVRQEQLVDDLDAVVSDPKRRHHLGRDGGRVRVGGLDGCHAGCWLPVAGETVALSPAILLSSFHDRRPPLFWFASAHVSEHAIT